MRFGIVGDPVDHSRSPVIHTAAYEAMRIHATFEAIRTPFDQFETVVEMLRSGQVDGVNVTMPHKHHAYESVDSHTPEAARTGAVNAITVEAGKLIGHNTDVGGVVTAWERMGADRDAPALILGAGGAAAAALVARDGHPVSVSARDDESANDLVSRTNGHALVVPWGEGVAGAVVVNATPIGMHGEALPFDPLAVASGLLDMAYGDSETQAVGLFRSNGRPVADGLDMLVCQAVEAFELFTGESAPFAVMMSAARASVV